jgi:hypothetical protein
MSRLASSGGLWIIVPQRLVRDKQTCSFAAKRDRWGVQMLCNICVGGQRRQRWVRAPDRSEPRRPSSRAGFLMGGLRRDCHRLSTEQAHGETACPVRYPWGTFDRGPHKPVDKKPSGIRAAVSMSTVRAIWLVRGVMWFMRSTGYSVIKQTLPARPGSDRGVGIHGPRLPCPCGTRDPFR